MNDILYEIVKEIKEIYNTTEYIPLHAPVFYGNEKKYLNECIDTTFVSSVGRFVDDFEVKMAQYTGAKYSIAVVNGTAALYIALKVVGVKDGDEVITQALTFVATANAIKYLNADPIFLDVDKDTFGLSPDSLSNFLKENVDLVNGEAINKITGKKISACVPMHTYGHPVRIHEIISLCSKYNIKVVEDAAEALGSKIDSSHCGVIGDLGVLSFNGNKTITTGGGGMILTSQSSFASHAKHITTTAKKPHPWIYMHDDLGYNFRMPNINAALGCAQLEQLDQILYNKRELAEFYKNYFDSLSNVTFLQEREGCVNNYWLNTILFDNKSTRDAFLKISNENGVMTRAVWTLVNEFPMYKDCQSDDLVNSKLISELGVNIPSGVRSKLN